MSSHWHLRRRRSPQWLGGTTALDDAAVLEAAGHGRLVAMDDAAGRRLAAAVVEVAEQLAGCYRGQCHEAPAGPPPL